MSVSASKKIDDEIEKFLESYDPAIRDLSRTLIGAVTTSMPSATVRYHPGWRLIGFRTGGASSRYFAFVEPRETTVRLGFEWGTSMLDSEKRLEGEGLQVRHLEFEPGAVIPSYTEQYIRESARVAMMPKEVLLSIRREDQP